MSTPATVVIPIPVENKRVPKTKRKMPSWTPERREKMRKAWERKRREREAMRKAERATRRKGLEAPTGRNRKPKARRSGLGRSTAGDAVLAALPGEFTARSGRTAGEERADAIVYLRAATEAIAHASDAELLALLALRRLQGRIK